MTPSIWRLIQKVSKNRVGTYRDWKAELAEEAHSRCVYCGLLDEVLGGQRYFHVEHYRPKTLRKDLENDYSNLFYACAVCNVYKGDDWPGEPDVTECTFLCPSQHDFSMYFIIKLSTLTGACIATDYMIERLHLNRPRLQILRREAYIRQELRDEFSKLKKIRQAINQRRTRTSLAHEIQDRTEVAYEKIIGAYQSLEQAYETSVGN